MELKLSPPVKTKIKHYIRYVDSLRGEDREGGWEQVVYIENCMGKSPIVKKKKNV